MELKFRLNDRVMLTSSAMSKYGNQSNGLSGVVVFAGERKNDVTRPYLVMWDKQKGPANSYMEEDLKLAGFKFQVVGEEEEVPVPESFHRSFNQVMFKAMFAPPIMDPRKIVTVDGLHPVVGKDMRVWVYDNRTQASYEITDLKPYLSKDQK